MTNPLRVRFVRDVALTGGTQVTQALLAMVSGILVARFLGAPAKGTVSVLVAVGTMAVLLASLGIHYSGIYFLGRFKSQREAIVSNTIAVGLLGGLAAGAALVVVGIVFRRQLLGTISLSLFLLYVLSVPSSYFNAFGRGLVLGAGRVGMYNLRDLIEGSGLLIGTAASIVIFGPHLFPLVALRVVIEAATALVLLVYVRRLFSFRFQPSKRVLHQQVAYGVRNYTSSLLWLFLLQSDLVLCNYFLGSGRAGVYSVAVSLGVPITFLATAAGTLTFQRVSSDDSRANRIANTNRTLRLLLPIVALSAGVMGASAHWLVPLLYGKQFGGAVDALILLVPGLVALSLELVPMNFLAGEGSPSIVYLAPLAGLFVNVVANLFVIPRWGINGAAATSSASYILVLVLVFRYYLRHTGSSLSEALISRISDVRALVGIRSRSAMARAVTRRA